MAVKNTPPAEKEFAFARKNYIYLLTGLVVIILGYALMAGGGSPNPNEFSMEIFSTRRITVAPIIVLLGFLIIGYAIMYKPKKVDNPGNKIAEKDPYQK